MLGVAVSHVEGMHPADSYDLLARLRAHMNQPQYAYSHKWRMGDLLIWNNTGTMHRARRSIRLRAAYCTASPWTAKNPIRAPA